MAKNDIMPKIGSWSFIIGIVISLLVGLYQATTIEGKNVGITGTCLLYTSPSPRDLSTSRMPSSA